MYATLEVWERIHNPLCGFSFLFLLNAVKYQYSCAVFGCETFCVMFSFLQIHCDINSNISGEVCSR